MTASASTRLGIYTWTAGTDAFTRSQMTDSMSALESKAAGFDQTGTRPTAGASYQGFFHYSSTDSSVGTLSYCNGTAWFDIGTFGTSTPTALTGATGAVGTASTYSRSDHRHALASDSVTTATITDANVTTAKIADDAVTTAKITDANVTTAKIADDNVTTAKIADDAVGADQLAANAVVTTSIVDDNVTHEKIEESVARSVLGVAGNAAAHVADIQAGTDHHVLRRSGTSIGFGTVATDGIADDAITHEKIEESAALSVLGVTGNAAAHVADIAAASDHKVLRRNGTSLGFGAVHTDGIANGAVTGVKLADDAVTAAKLATNSVGDDAIANSSVSFYAHSGSAKDGYKIYIQASEPAHGLAGNLWFQT
tara:strand:+ start:13273 stop:14379 length:1107 start_codon:yes stop_codon:yes gene_type:complete